MRIVAGIVTYEPDLARLTEAMTAVRPQVEALLVLDNASSNSDGIAEIAASADFQRNSKNRGVSAALNQIMRWAENVGADAVLLLDQDSVPAYGMVAALSEHLVGTVGEAVPRYIDRNLTKEIGPPGDPTVRDVPHWITSGSLVSVAAWREAGGFDEDLFIDYVDFDFCGRLADAGRTVRVVPHALLMHEVGQSMMRGGIRVWNHSAFRMFYIARDMLVYVRKHPRGTRRFPDLPTGLLGALMVLAKRAAVIAAFERGRRAKLEAMARGTRRGLAALHS
ncbi:glycosyltransferase family 2 protein [Agreia pratensis]|uniref:Rhamnosyltransferase n=1 Tax=Agreia pratensis TaxID=150121 RepID=A0A1X7IN81_9MICO|nr:glycosyltransferase family 2 protein [Agreia pratensis]SMG16200.1 rhamnosyltransferase [Agreia pratensis]